MSSGAGLGVVVLRHALVDGHEQLQPLDAFSDVPHEVVADFLIAVELASRFFLRGPSDCGPVGDLRRPSLSAFFQRPSLSVERAIE